jgi:hypothetical protein
LESQELVRPWSLAVAVSTKRDQVLQAVRATIAKPVDVMSLRSKAATANAGVEVSFLDLPGKRRVPTLAPVLRLVLRARHSPRGLRISLVS